MGTGQNDKLKWLTWSRFQVIFKQTQNYFSFVKSRTTRSAFEIFRPNGPVLKLEFWKCTQGRSLQSVRWRIGKHEDKAEQRNRDRLLWAHYFLLGTNLIFERRKKKCGSLKQFVTCLLRIFRQHKGLKGPSFEGFRFFVELANFSVITWMHVDLINSNISQQWGKVFQFVLLTRVSSKKIYEGTDHTLGLNSPI